MNTDVVTYAERTGALSIVDVKAQVTLIQQVMREVMHKDEHYGVIPGTGTKPSLLKAGAEKLCLTFRLDPQYEIEQKQEGAHLTIMSKCTLFHIPSGQRYGSGMGSCSTKESKYAYRNAAAKCPECGQEAIIKGKEEYGGGYVCFKKKGGCNAKFTDDDKRITEQPKGRVQNEDIADQYNTVLKMANKRSLVAAVLNTTAASDIFTQDIEDMPAYDEPPRAKRTHKDAASKLDPEPQDGPVTAEQAAELASLCAQTKITPAAFLSKAGAQSWETMLAADYADAKALFISKGATVAARTDAPI